MSPGDEDEVVETVENEGTPSEGAEGQDDAEQGADASGDAAEHPDDQEDDGQQEVEGEPAVRSRGETRFQRLANETKAAKEEAAATRRELEGLRRQQQASQTQFTAQQEQERLALMTPQERTEYQLARMQQGFTAQFGQMQLQTQAMLDKTAFAAKAAVNPVYQRHEAEVENKFNELLQSGRPTDRETILKFILGERALNGASAGRAKAAKAGAKRVENQRVAAGSARGDTASNRGKTGQTAEDRLKGQYI